MGVSKSMVSKARGQVSTSGQVTTGRDGKQYPARERLNPDDVRKRAAELGCELSCDSGEWKIKKGNKEYWTARRLTLRGVQHHLDRGIDWDDVDEPSPPPREVTPCDCILNAWETAPPEDRALFVRTVYAEILEHIPPPEWALDDEA